MKTRVVCALLVVAAIPFLSSCSKSSDPKPDPIVGTWTRVDYTFTNLPTGFTKYWQNYKVTSFGEGGYTLVIKSDKTYSRGFEGWQVSQNSPIVNVNDAGKWTLDNSTSLTLEPDDADDKSTILDQNYFPIGLEFTVEGTITDSKMVLSRTINLPILPDATLDALNADPTMEVTNDDYVAVDIKILYNFRKL